MTVSANNDNTVRTHRCGEVNEHLIGETVRVAGWANKIRNLGGVVFVGLRDRYGLVQVVCEDGTPLEAAGDFRLESVILFEGEVLTYWLDDAKMGQQLRVKNTRDGFLGFSALPGSRFQLRHFTVKYGKTGRPVK